MLSLMLGPSVGTHCQVLYHKEANVRVPVFLCGPEWGGLMACDSQHTPSSVIMRLFTAHKQTEPVLTDTQVSS